MTFHVFRLLEGKAPQGVVVIFETPLPQVWRRLTTDKRAEEVPTVTHLEAAKLLGELQALPIKDDPTRLGGTVLQQIFHDGAITGNHRAIYIRKDDFKKLSDTPSPASLRSYVEQEYEREQQEHRPNPKESSST